MPRLLRAAAVAFGLVLAFTGSVALADPDRDEAHWRERYRAYDQAYGDREYEEKYVTADGCFERKWKKGEYEEKVKCRDRYRRQAQ